MSSTLSVRHFSLGDLIMRPGQQPRFYPSTGGAAWWVLTKPRLRLRHGTWTCGGSRGFTPRAAYEYWLRIECGA
jgi:hypothetical protein